MLKQPLRSDALAMVGARVTLTICLGLMSSAQAATPLASLREANVIAPRDVEFASVDGLLVSAQFFEGVAKDAPSVVLFHQSGSSHGEFSRVAPALQALGYHALAVDLRWGGSWLGVMNKTAERNGTPAIMNAVKAGTAKPWPTADASYADMRSALRWLQTNGYRGPRFVLGSSFSAMLVFRLGVEEEVQGVMAFSPGDYDESRPGLVTGWAGRIKVPVLSVAAAGEEDLVTPIANAVTSEGSRYFVARKGKHGASVLDADPLNWEVLASFLSHHTGGPPRRTEVTIKTPEGTPVVLDSYTAPRGSKLAALFHQGDGSARGEYGFLIPHLLAAGYHVIAADLHGGGDRFAFPNRTAALTPEAPDFTYCHALPELRAVLRYARELHPKAVLTVIGSSYTAALVLRVAAEPASQIDRVVAASPASGEPMADCGADASAPIVALPVLVMRPESEAIRPAGQEQLDMFRKRGYEVFVATHGVHGASILNPMRVKGDISATEAALKKFLDAPSR